MSDFLSHWFQGCMNGLACMKKEQQDSFFRECGKACSKSYSLQVYQKIRKESIDVPDFFEKLNSAFEEIHVIEVEKGKTYEIKYHKCLCDLYTEGYITSGLLCECSRSSLQYNLESIFPESKITVILEGSILQGDSECVLRVTLA